MTLQTSSPQPSMADAALELSALGYDVFPCEAGAKTPLTKHGFKDASRDPAAIRRWWAKHPNANIGVATAGLVVFDVDGAENDWVEKSPGYRKFFDSAPAARTPRGGWHFVFRAPAGSDFRCSTSVVADHVDIRANGGYIVVAPSRTEDGSYAWVRPLTAPCDLPELPPTLAELLMLTAKSEPASKPTVSKRFPEGERNARLTSIAGRMRRRGRSEQDIADELLKVNRDRCIPPLDDEEVRAIAESIARYAPKSEESASSNLPTIIIDTDEHRVVDETITALTQDDGLFCRAGRLVRLLSSSEIGQGRQADNPPAISEVPQANLRDRITMFARFARIGKDGEEFMVHPPSWLVKAIEARGNWPGIRPLTGISFTPFIRPDRTICQTPGYDGFTGVLFIPSEEFPPIPERPTKDDAVRAVAELKEVVCNFPFETPSCCSAFLAALATPFVRFAFWGTSPLFLFDGNVRGAGKTLLARVAGRISLGAELPVTSYTDNQEELRKAITTTVIAGDRVVLFDNLEGKIGSATLDRAITGLRWRDRILGGNTLADMPLNVTWYASGNNVVMTADAARRVIRCRLVSQDERPELRGGLKHPDLMAYVIENRARLVTAVLTMLRAFAVAGSPNVTAKPLGGFENWSSSVRDAIVFAGEPDPCNVLAAETAEIDESRSALGQLLQSLEEAYPDGFLASEVARQVFPTDGTASLDQTLGLIKEALDELGNARSGRALSSTEVAKVFRMNKQRVVGYRMLDQAGKKGNRGVRWQVVRVGIPPTEPGKSDAGDASDGTEGRPEIGSLKTEQVAPSPEEMSILERPWAASPESPASPLDEEDEDEP